MVLSALQAGSLIEWGVAGRPLGGEGRSGDLHVVKEFEDGVLVAAIDGLGHGDRAADAAAGAADVLERHAAEPLELLVGRCHEAIRHLRGVVMGLARFTRQSDSMTWLGIGDTAAVLIRQDIQDDLGRTLPQHRGVVGVNKLPKLESVGIDLTPGDVVIMASDGIHHTGLRRGSSHFTPQFLAMDILARSARANDDAMVLVVQYRGRA
jgi:hypothetical protein